MVLAERSIYKMKWAREHPESAKAAHQRYIQKITVKKRCPSCKKHFTVRKDYPSFHPIIHCKSCGVKIRIIKTLSESIKNAHGLRIKVVE